MVYVNKLYVMHRTSPKINRKRNLNQDNKTDDELMYADLELFKSEYMGSNSHHRMPLPRNLEATVYADK